ncbi:MAG: hypothetical protein E7265_12120 [Lachnospiraceae bacterium]|nr:hypothetical protein [Lachnospiraceae bacterium]
MKDMSYEKFCERMKDIVQQYYGVEANVKLQTVQKVNGVVLHGITVMKEDRSIMPTLYLEYYYDIYNRGTALHDVVHQFVLEYDKACIYDDFDISFFEYYEKVKPHLGYKLINYEMNRELLKEIPHKCYLDLAIVCYCNIVDDRIGKGTILIRNEHLDIWKVEKDIIIRDSLKNMPSLFPADVINMADLLKELYDDPAQLICGKLPMYVLTTKARMYGAAAILYSGQLEAIAREVEDDFYLLPSSIHEIIILPKKYATDEEHLSQMVDEINHEQLDIEEVLSNHAYLYSSLTKEITSLPLIPCKSGIN